MALIHLENLVAALENRGLLSKYKKVLPTPDFIKDVIYLVNSGKVGVAVRKVSLLEECVLVVSADLSGEDNLHFNEVIVQLRDAIDTYKSEA